MCSATPARQGASASCTLHCTARLMAVYILHVALYRLLIASGRDDDVLCLFEEHASCLCGGILLVTLYRLLLVSGRDDDLLCWFEEYASRLCGGTYVAAPLDADDPSSRAISLFPLQPPGLVQEVTKGVKVRGEGEGGSW